MKKFLGVLLFTLMTVPFFAAAGSHAETADSGVSGSAVNISARAAVLIEGDTGEIIYEKNKDTELVPASITKIMTLTLIFDAIEQGKISLEDEVTVSEYAASMGGSQVFLEPRETQTVNTMIKCISIASANDAAVAMAEKIAGSEQNFVKMMNEKARKLGMKHTQVKNCSGLDDDIKSGHFSSAYDVALMSRELIMEHPEISDYSTVWMDSITHKTKKGETEFGLTNTNKLVRFYDGITGLKTGSTSKAKYCLSATASKDGIDLIAVVMGAPDNKVRFQDAMALLNFGYSVSNVYVDENKEALPSLTVKGGVEDEVNLSFAGEFRYLDTKGSNLSQIEETITLPELVEAPVAEGQAVGEAVYKLDGQRIGGVSIVAAKTVEKAGYRDYVVKLIHMFLL